MNEIICPSCKKAFKVDEAGFANILKQVRDHQFDEELNQRLILAEKEKKSAVELAEAKLKISVQEQLALKDKEIAKLTSKNENAEIEKKLSVSEAVKNIEKERDNLANKLELKESEKKLLETSLSEKFSTDLKAKDDIIRFKVLN